MKTTMSRLKSNGFATIVIPACMLRRSAKVLRILRMVRAAVDTSGVSMEECALVP
jgi:hypothetical protein